MEQWSIVSNIDNYVQYNRYSKNFYDFDFKTVDQKNHKNIYGRLKEEET